MEETGAHLSVSAGAVPRLVQLYAPVVTGDNVDEYIDSAFES